MTLATTRSLVGAVASSLFTLAVGASTVGIELGSLEDPLGNVRNVPQSEPLLVILSSTGSSSVMTGSQVALDSTISASTSTETEEWFTATTTMTTTVTVVVTEDGSLQSENISDSTSEVIRVTNTTESSISSSTTVSTSTGDVDNLQLNLETVSSASFIQSSSQTRGITTSESSSSAVTSETKMVTSRTSTVTSESASSVISDQTTLPTNGTTNKTGRPGNSGEPMIGSPNDLADQDADNDMTKPLDVAPIQPSGTEETVPSDTPAQEEPAGFPVTVGNARFYGCVGSTEHYPTFVLVDSQDDMDLDICASLCNGFEYAGAADRDCYCGNEIDNEQTKLLDKEACNRPCPGNPSQICGGMSGTNKAWSLRVRQDVPDEVYLTVYLVLGIAFEDDDQNGGGEDVDQDDGGEDVDQDDSDEGVDLIIDNDNSNDLDLDAEPSSNLVPATTSAPEFQETDTMILTSTTTVYLTRPAVTSTSCEDGSCVEPVTILRPFDCDICDGEEVFVLDCDDCDSPGYEDPPTRHGHGWKPLLCKDGCCKGKTLYKPDICIEACDDHNVVEPEFCAECDGGVSYIPKKTVYYADEYEIDETDRKGAEKYNPTPHHVIGGSFVEIGKAHSYEDSSESRYKTDDGSSGEGHDKPSNQADDADDEPWYGTDQEGDRIVVGSAERLAAGVESLLVGVILGMLLL